MADHILRQGDTFQNFDELEKTIKDYSKVNNVIFVKCNAKKVETYNKTLLNADNHLPLDFKYSQVDFKCKCFGNYDSQSSGLRRVQK